MRDDVLPNFPQRSLIIAEVFEKCKQKLRFVTFFCLLVILNRKLVSFLCNITWCSARCTNDVPDICVI